MASKDIIEKNSKGERFKWDDANGRWVPLPKPGEPFDFDAGQMILNVPESTAKLVKDSLYPVLHPVRTAVGIKNLALGVAGKVIPGKQDQEIFADAFADMMKDRYGGIQQLQRTLETDPIGILSDVAGLVATAGGVGAKVATTGSKLSKVAATSAKIGRAVDPVNLATQAFTKSIARIPGIQGATESLFKSGAKFPTSRKGNPAQQLKTNQRNVRTSLGTGGRPAFPPGDRSVGRLALELDDLSSQKQALHAAADPAAEVTARGVLDEFQGAIDEFDIPGNPERRANVAKLNKQRTGFIESIADQKLLDQLQANIRLAPDPDSRTAARLALNDYLDEVAETGTLSLREAEAAKQLLGRRQKFGVRTDSAAFEGQAGIDALRQAQRKQIQDAIPGLEEINARMSDLLELQDPLTQATSRINNRNSFSLPQIGSTIAGATIGSAGGGIGITAGASIGAMVGLLTSPTVQTRGAVILQSLIDAGVDPNIALTLSPLLAAQSGKAAGRAGQQEEFQ